MAHIVFTRTRHLHGIAYSSIWPCFLQFLTRVVIQIVGLFPSSDRFSLYPLPTPCRHTLAQRCPRLSCTWECTGFLKRKSSLIQWYPNSHCAPHFLCMAAYQSHPVPYRIVPNCPETVAHFWPRQPRKFLYSPMHYNHISCNLLF